MNEMPRNGAAFAHAKPAPAGPLDRWRGIVLWLLLAASLAALAFAGWRWFEIHRQNTRIAELLAGRDIEVDLPKASSRLLAAKGYYYLSRDFMEQAQPVLDQASFAADPGDRADLLFNMANTRLRRAYQQIDEGHFDKAISLVNLAKDEYRQALKLEPRAWDAKFNLDLAMRLVRDLPQPVPPEDEEPQQKPEQRLWMDLPGVPRGNP